MREKCIVTKETVLEGKEPKLIINPNKEIKKEPVKKQRKTTNKNEQTA